MSSTLSDALCPKHAIAYSNDPFLLSYPHSKFLVVHGDVWSVQRPGCIDAGYSGGDGHFYRSLQPHDGSVWSYVHGL